MCGCSSPRSNYKSLLESWKCSTQVLCCITPHHTRLSLLIIPSIDDVEDGSSLRRGFPVAHSIYGVPQTINSANYVYFCTLRELERLDNPRLFKIFYGLYHV